MSVKHFSRRSFAIVHFRENLVLQIPLQATDHSGNHFPACAKLSCQVLKDLAVLAKDDDIQCLVNPKMSGEDYLSSNNKILSNPLN